MTVSPAPRGPKKNEEIFRERPTSAFWSGGGCRGERPAKPTNQHHPAAAVLPVQWQGANGGLMFTSASRWRRSRRTGQNGGSQAVRPRPDRVEIFALGENTTRCLTATKPERQGEGTGSRGGPGSARGGTALACLGGCSPQTPKQIQSKFKVKIPETLDTTGFFGVLLVSKYEYICIEFSTQMYRKKIYKCIDNSDITM